MAPDLVGDDPRICQCAECRSFSPPARGQTRRPGKYGPPVAWRGRWWWRTKWGYYNNARAGGRLHRKIYETHVGPIPKGFDVHHVDEDTSNNRLSNFELLTRSDHTSHHIVQNGRLNFNRFQPQTKLCAVCGDPFTALLPKRKLYCSSACNCAAFRVRGGRQRSRDRKAAAVGL